LLAKAAVEQATILNVPKQALLDLAARCETWGLPGGHVLTSPKAAARRRKTAEGFADAPTFFRDLPHRLHPLQPWTRSIRSMTRSSKSICR
jgi:hypothetical protein